MKNILKNAETEHLEEVIGFTEDFYNETGSRVHGFRFTKCEDNGDGTYTPERFSEPIDPKKPYIWHYGWSGAFEITFGGPVTFSTRKYNESTSSWEVITINGRTAEATWNNGEVRQFYTDEDTLYSATGSVKDGVEIHYHQYDITHFDVRKIQNEKDILASIVPGVSYDGDVVSYNGYNCEVNVVGSGQTGNITLTSFTQYGEYMPITSGSVNEYISLYEEVVPKLSGYSAAVGCLFFNENGEKILNGGLEKNKTNYFALDERVKRIEISLSWYYSDAK